MALNQWRTRWIVKLSSHFSFHPTFQFIVVFICLNHTVKLFMKLFLETKKGKTLPCKLVHLILIVISCDFTIGINSRHGILFNELLMKRIILSLLLNAEMTDVILFFTKQYIIECLFAIFAPFRVINLRVFFRPPKIHKFVNIQGRHFR